MKKLALTSLLAVFAVSGANAATNYFVGGAAGIARGTINNNATVLAIAPEFGWKYNADWDFGVAADFGYDHNQYLLTNYGVDGDAYDYGFDLFARYKVAQFGGVKLLLKGMVGADFMTVKPENAPFTSETASSISASIVPMVTYDVSEAITLYANLNFLGATFDYNFANDTLGIAKSWGFGANVDSGRVANTGAFQIGFNYNF